VPQSGQREAVRNVFTQLLKASQDKKYYLLPPGHQGQIAVAVSEEAKVRIVADCISGMTEKEIMHFHRNLQGLL
jgi:dGTP triphosphohydrolase